MTVAQIIILSIIFLIEVWTGIELCLAAQESCREDTIKAVSYLHVFASITVIAIAVAYCIQQGQCPQYEEVEEVLYRIK